MDTDPSGSGGWRFAQCFGDKGEVEDITEGVHYPSPLACLIELSLIQSCTAQRILSRRLSSTQRGIIWQQGTRVAESFSSSAMSRYASDYFSAPLTADGGYDPRRSVHIVDYASDRKKAASTNSIQSFNPMNPSSTTSNHWKSKRRSTR
jgi:hypothetical protein